MVGMDNEVSAQQVLAKLLQSVYNRQQLLSGGLIFQLRFIVLTFGTLLKLNSLLHQTEQRFSSG